MDCNVFSLNDSQKWHSAYETLPVALRDVYYRADFYRINQGLTGAEAKCFVCSEDEKLFLYPFLKTKVNPGYIVGGSTYYDIEGAYGYNGPLYNTDDINFLKEVSRRFLEMCRDENIIAEFTRFNPVLENHKALAHIEPMAVNENIVLDLETEDIWMKAYEHSTRKNINKAIRSGLTVKYVEGWQITSGELNEFVGIYMDTMKRNRASSVYHFPDSYFLEMAQLPGGSHFFFTMNEGNAVSCELVTAGSTISYSFLGGTNEQFFSLRANDLLKHEIIQKMKQLGLRYFCLGGGTTPNDGIFRYKKCFAKDGVKKFYIGRKVHNETVYNNVVKNWEDGFPQKKEMYKNHILKYRN